MRDPRPAASLAAGLVIAVLLAGCGGSSQKSNGKATPEAYVNQVCGSVALWLRAVETSSAEISNELKPGSTPTHAKQALQGLMDSSVADSERVVDGLRAAGTPDVTNGEQIAGALLGSFVQATNALKGVQAQVRRLPTNDPSAFQGAVKSVGTSVQSSLSSIGSGLTTLHSTELQKAASESPACKSLGTA